MLSGGISYIIIRMFKPKIKSVKKIKENPFYDPIRIFMIVLGVYLAILFLKVQFGISEIVMLWVTKAFKIISILVFSNGFAKSFTTKGNFVNKLRDRVNANVDDAMFNFILKAVRFIIYAIAVFLVVMELGYDLTGVIAGLGVGGLIITLAAQDTAKNLFGGLVIFLDKPFVVGDWIQMDTYEGTVEDVKFRSTNIRTLDNAVLHIPNSEMAISAVINYSEIKKRRYYSELILELDTELQKVENVKLKIKEMLLKKEYIIQDSIIVRFQEIADNGINVVVIAYVNETNYAEFLKIKEQINYEIMAILQSENVELAYNTQTIYVKK